MKNERQKGKAPLLLFACLFLGALAATAAPPPGPANGPDPALTAARLLQLSDSQISEWREILQARDEATRPLAREVQVRERELRRALDGDRPDPNVVGALVIEINRLQQELLRIRHASGDQLLGTLDDDQLQRVDEAADAAPLVPAVRSFQALGLI